MSTITEASDVSEAPIVSKQCTKLTPVSTKLEWRIEHFDKAMQFYKRDQEISSKTFTLPLPDTVVWRLDVYPHGELSPYPASDDPHFYLRLIGFQTSDGSLSADKTTGVMADYKMYLLSSTNEEKIVKQALSEFKVATMERLTVNAEEVKKFIDPDGSLLVICEVECLVPKKTLSMEPTSNLHLIKNFKEMWKSHSFTDCTLKVGSKSFPAHKCILGQWSKVFHNMFSLPLEESKNGIVEIEDFSADSISAMLEYMYTGLVKNELMYKLSPELLALSDKYVIIPLKEMCEAFMASKLTTKNLLQVVIMADRFSAPKLKKICYDRLTTDGRAVLQSKEWEDLKSKDKVLANELLELMIKDNLSVVVHKAPETRNRTRELLHWARKHKTYEGFERRVQRLICFWR